MKKDAQLIWEAYITEQNPIKTAFQGVAPRAAQLASTPLGGKVANVVAGTKIGQKLGGHALNTLLGNLRPEEKTWLTDNIDNQAALQSGLAQRAGAVQDASDATGVTADTLQQVITNMLQQPNVKDIVKQWLANNPSAATPAKPAAAAAQPAPDAENKEPGFARWSSG